MISKKMPSAILLTSTLIMLVSVTLFPSKAFAGELDVLGGKLTWSDRMYVADSCSKYDFEYKNLTGVELLVLGFELNDPFGRSMTNRNQVGIKPNVSGTWNMQICAGQFTNGLGPYTIKLIVKDFGGTQRQATKEIYFLPLPGASPTPTVTITARPSPAPTVTVTAQPLPAPTVTVTATPVATIDPYFENESIRLRSELTSIKKELDKLKAKLNKVCGAKPKPKNC